MRKAVKIRTVAGSVVVTLPTSVLEAVDLEPGDRVVVESAPPLRLIITKQGEIMQTSERLELEIDLLEKKKKALESDIRYKQKQYEDSMPTEAGMEDSDVAQLILAGLARDHDQIEVEISEKRLALHDVLGDPLEA